MQITRLQLKNWRNFTQADIQLRETAYIIGANATGKSNLLDALRFLHDVAMPKGGGLQKAIEDRGGVGELRSLAAHRDPEISISIELSEKIDSKEPLWRYELAFRKETSGQRRNIVTLERVSQRKNGVVLERPDRNDQNDPELLTQTALENTLSNRSFRDINRFLSSITYLHLVPQLVRYRDRFLPTGSDDNPFGQSLMERIAKTGDKSRQKYLKRLEEALNLAVPQLHELRFIRDAMGRPHLEARYQHWRANGARQREDQFSDGTLRLIGLLWCLMEGHSPLLLEEPELSLNDAIVERIPLLIENVQSQRTQQLFITTHSFALLSNPGIDGRQLVFLEPGDEGTRVRGITPEEAKLLSSGFSLAEIMLPKARPEGAARICLE